MDRMRWKRIGVTLASCAVGVVLIELASGFIFDRLPPSYVNGKWLVERYAGLPSEASLSQAPHPYCLYRNAPNYEAWGFRQHNSLGYRGPEFDVRKAPGQVRIVALGGSTTHMLPFVADPRNTWPARLEARLRETHPRVQVVNAGMSYATSAELLASYVFRHRYLKPDVLIVHEGGNDVYPAMFEGYDPEYTHFRAPGTSLEPRPGEASLLAHSRFARLLYAMWLNGQDPIYRAQPYEFAKVDREKALERVRSNDGAGFRRNIDTLIRLAKEDGTKVVLFGFLQARKELLARNRPEFAGLEEALETGLAKNDAILRELSVEHGVPFVVPNRLLFDDAWFYDNCHLNEQGEEVKAGILLEFLEGAGERYLGR